MRSKKTWIVLVTGNTVQRPYTQQMRVRPYPFFISASATPCSQQSNLFPAQQKCDDLVYIPSRKAFISLKVVLQKCIN